MAYPLLGVSANVFLSACLIKLIVLANPKVTETHPASSTNPGGYLSECECIQSFSVS